MGIIRHTKEYKTAVEKREYDRLKAIKDMNQALHHYSNGTNQCAKCGESRREFLTLDHIHADKKNWNEAHGISKNTGGYVLARALRVRNWPEGIQVLCYNCNVHKGSHIIRAKNVERIEYKKNYAREVKKRAIVYFGDKCSCCGESNINYLSIEHSNGDGKKHRQGIKLRYNLQMNERYISGHSFYVYVLKDVERGITWPGLEVHCHNCNSSKGFHGFCPHQVERGQIILDQYGQPLTAIKEVYV